jgi:Cu(I)/Ag(I) efflux system periplasmic protein CusF
MKRLPLILTLAVLATALAACGKKPAEPMADAAPAAPVPASGDAMAGMDMAGSTMAKGTGTVTEIDKTAGTITLDHGPIEALKWPAMTMSFKATPATLLDTVKVGDKVSFDLKMTGGSGEVTAIQAQ